MCVCQIHISYTFPRDFIPAGDKAIASFMNDYQRSSGK